MRSKSYHHILGLLYLTLYPLLAQSQPSLSISAIPEIGKQVVYAGFERDVDPGPTGGNVSWDFSDVSLDEIDTAFVFVRTFQSPEKCLGYDSFPQATHCVAQYFDLLVGNESIESVLDTLFDFYSYLRIADDSIFDLGSVNDISFFGTTFNVLEKPEPILIFNLDFEESQVNAASDTIVDTVLESFVDTRTMLDMDNTTYDAYGTIKLPNYELTNAVRHKTTSLDVETFERKLVNDTTVFSFNLDSSYSETIAWYHESSIMPYVVIQKEVTCMQYLFRGDTVINSCDSSVSYTYQTDFEEGSMTTSLSAVNGDLALPPIYPTYTNGIINIDIPLRDKKLAHRLTVRNMSGQQVSEQQLSSGHNTLDLNLSPGMYLLSIDGYQPRKVVVF